MVKINPSAVKANKGQRVQPTEHGAAINYKKSPPVFSLSQVRKSHCITNCEQREKSDFAEMLRKLSQCIWHDLENSNYHGIGCERIKRLKVKRPEDLSDDTIFIAFRFSGMKPMVGHRENDVFHILWFDREFNVYDHG
ncbi:MAG: hypothetical protein Q7N50_15725 [Armatimonadota bacterium]|nr:hypothetical protein [Armatimonadota bacterium]